MAKQGTCRFCGQQLMIENGDDMTDPQREEHATRNCDCDEAKKYQEAALRRDVAKKRANELFGEGAGEFAQPEDMLQLIKAGVDMVCDKKAKQVSITINTGLKCRIMQMAKDKVKIVREIAEKDSFEQ